MTPFWFFDFDGTLADTDADIRLAWRQTLAEIPLPHAPFDEVFRNGPALDALVEAFYPGKATPELKAQIRAAFRTHYDASGFPNTHPYPGVENLLHALKDKGHTLIIASNKRHCALKLLVEKLAWENLVSGIYAPDMFPDRRFTKTQFLAQALADFSIPPAAATMVGDTKADIDAGHANGMHTVGVTWGYGARDELAAAETLWEVPPCL